MFSCASSRLGRRRHHLGRVARRPPPGRGRSGGRRPACRSPSSARCRASRAPSSSRVSAATRSAGTTRFTRPQASAVGASIGLAGEQHLEGVLAPDGARRARRPAWCRTSRRARPARRSGRVSDATARSQDATSWQPAAIASPSTCAITTCGSALDRQHQLARRRRAVAASRRASAPAMSCEVVTRREDGPVGGEDHAARLARRRRAHGVQQLAQVLLGERVAPLRAAHADLDEGRLLGDGDVAVLHGGPPARRRREGYPLAPDASRARPAPRAAPRAARDPPDRAADALGRRPGPGLPGRGRAADARRHRRAHARVARGARRARSTRSATASRTCGACCSPTSTATISARPRRCARAAPGLEVWCHEDEAEMCEGFSAERDENIEGTDRLFRGLRRARPSCATRQRAHARALRAPRTRSATPRAIDRRLRDGERVPFKGFSLAGDPRAGPHRGPLPATTSPAPARSSPATT